MGESLAIKPKISTEHSIAKVVVPDEAGNAKVGFSSAVASLDNSKF